MILEQYYLDCLSQASYLIGDETTGRAVVVDPRRDVDVYLEDAGASGLTIDLVVETHLHADFLSGHLELAAATGAEVCFGVGAVTEFPSRQLRDGERIELGEVVLEVLHTPGHTPESLCLVVYEHADDTVPHAVLTGDTLFIGDVGRPDLLSAIGHSPDGLADQLFHSLHDKLLVLPDDTLVLPAHGAGSSCGKNLSSELTCTIGRQKLTNHALRVPDKEAFVALVTDGQPPAPDYFVYDAVLNRRDHDLLDPDVPTTPLDLADVQRAVADGAVVLDAREPETFGRGHLTGSVNVGLEGRFAEFAGSVVATDADIVLVAESGLEREARNRLARIGFDRVIGHLADPAATFADNPGSVQRSSRLTATDLGDCCETIDDLQVLDVRNPGETVDGTIGTAITIPLAQLRRRLDELDPARPTVVYCAGGYRSSIAVSLLRRAGFDDVSDLRGGYQAWSTNR